MTKIEIYSSSLHIWIMLWNYGPLCSCHTQQKDNRKGVFGSFNELIHPVYVLDVFESLLANKKVWIDCKIELDILLSLVIANTNLSLRFTEIQRSLSGLIANVFCLASFQISWTNADCFAVSDKKYQNTKHQDNSSLRSKGMINRNYLNI